ncbi:oligosaccharide flippase family protein [Pelagimonas varians]|uniref:Lipopolysaccharide biosynthesis protein WzxC n=1 Tax=Pelagimonas varians TaxID=696760 RepID=A0A238K7M8_9RHOB|nr:oligosaccharide flippase family protein [Pelagimonas varians]PYG31903.1 O-antigen/teichoic acid export membrane protein [Pelagimonas varians]SMX38454.1 Lipopolysaccharide biosynthesis protein WzxC [Pelagimonas varians]
MSVSVPPILSNLLAFGASEIATKLSRLVVVVAVARTLDLTEIGIAAAALATGDMLKSLTENGIGQRLIAATNLQLPAMCNRAHALFWIWCLGLFFVQAALALILWFVTKDAALAMLVLVLAGEYLFMPGGLVQVALALRSGKLKRIAAIAGTQAVSANMLSVVLALIWPSALVLVLPRLLTAPFWLWSVRRLHPWKPEPAAGLSEIKPFFAFGGPVLATEIVKAARLHADKLIVGALLGPQALGMYFMAFNAGLSIATSFSTAFAAVLFPHLCSSPDRSAALRQALGVSLSLVAPVVVLQALLAPWYVPRLLGEGWADLAEPVSILCLAAIPTMIWTAAAGWFRAENKTGLELRATAILTTALMANTILMSPFGLIAIAYGYLATSTAVMLILSRPALAAAFTPALVKA